MTQIEIAKKVGITQGHLSLIINGKRRPSWDIAIVLAALTETAEALWMDGEPGAKRAALESLERSAHDK